MEKKPKRSDALQKMADAAGLSRSQMAQARAAGVDCKNLPALKAFRGTINTRSDGRQKPGGDTPSGGSRELMTLEEIETALRAKGISTNDARTLKIQLEGLKAATALRQQRNQLLSRAEVDERDAKIGQAVRGALLRLESEIPPKLYGLELHQSRPAVKQEARAVLTMLEDQSSAFWRDHPEHG